MNRSNVNKYNDYLAHVLSTARMQRNWASGGFKNCSNARELIAIYRNESCRLFSLFRAKLNH